MNDATANTTNDGAAQERRARLKDFYEHLCMFATFAIIYLWLYGAAFGFDRPPVQWLPYAFALWGIGVVVHGLRTYRQR
jgi:hypothetical protein